MAQFDPGINNSGKGFPVMFLQELMNQPPTKWVCQGVIPEDSTVLVWGDSGSCKSFLVIDLGLHMAHGITSWHGHRLIQGAVAYIVAEGAGGTRKRMKGWHQHRHMQPNAPFIVIPTAVNFTNGEQVRSLITELRRIERELGIKFQMIIIDTLAKCMKGGDESGAADMGTALSHADKVREDLKAVVLIVPPLRQGCGSRTTRFFGVKGRRLN